MRAGRGGAISTIKDTHILDNAFEGGIRMSLEEVLDRVAGFSARYVSVTGGEPLAQQVCLALLTSLCDAGYRVSLEARGALDLSAVDPRVTRVMDLKTPGSGEVERNLYSNIQHLHPPDQIKFVLCDEQTIKQKRIPIK